MTVLISGASGFIGRKLSERLHEKGFKVFCLTRNVKKTSKFLPYAKVFLWRDFNQDPPSEAFENVSVVVNLVGESVVRRRWSPQQKIRLRSSRVDLTKKLAQAARKAGGVHTFISSSAVGYYGSREDTILDEESPPGRGFLAHLCTEWEKASAIFEDSSEENSERRLVIFRLANVLSSEGGMLQKMLPFFRLGLGVRMSSGRQWLSWIHIEDLLDFYLSAMQNKSWRGPFNVVSLHPVIHQEFSKTLARVLGRPLFFKIGDSLLNMIFGEMSQVFSDSTRVVPLKAQKKGFIFKHPRLDFALKHLLKRS